MGNSQNKGLTDLGSTLRPYSKSTPTLYKSTRQTGIMKLKFGEYEAKEGKGSYAYSVRVGGDLTILQFINPSLDCNIPTTLQGVGMRALFL